MRTSAHLYPSSILVLFLLELLGPRFVAARVRYHSDDSIEVSPANTQLSAGNTTIARPTCRTSAGLAELRLREATRARSDHCFPAGLQTCAKTKIASTWRTS